MSHIIIEGMCYSGKTTLGKLLSQKIKKSHLDFGDVFKKIYDMKETEYLAKNGKEKFADLEKKMMLTEFENISDSIISISGSAIYYSKEMQHIANMGTVIFIDVPFSEISQRMKKEGKLRAIVIPDEINSFEELYIQRKKIYLKYADVIIYVHEGETIDTSLNKLLKTLKY